MSIIKNSKIIELEKCSNLKLIRIVPAKYNDRNSGKSPMGSGWQKPEKQFTSPEAIKQLENLPNLNFGIPTGPCQDFNLVVIDVDVADGKEGDFSRANLEIELGSLPVTWESITGSGGQHYYYKIPNDLMPTNRVGVAPGLDIRAGGGYVVAPGSDHYSGGTYAWVKNRSPIDIEIADLPDAWIKKVLAIKNKVLIDNASKKPRINNSATEFRKIELHGGLEDCTYFLGFKVTRHVNYFFYHTVKNWIVGASKNPPWITPLFNAALDCERCGVSMEHFIEVLASVAPLQLSQKDLFQIRRGYEIGATKSTLHFNPKKIKE